ncbi:MAG: diacylglycerol/lipid kinase family protein [Longimicrobiales bacterium]
MTRARLILNPSSGRERGPEHIETMSARLRRKYDALEMTVTAGDGDAERAALIAVEDGCEALFVAGGDGTLNEAMNGLASAGFLDRIAVGIIPFGTGNDFAAALGIPVDVESALDLLLEGRELRVDLGQVNGRVFVNTSGGGFIAEVSVAVTPQLKTIAGRLAYLIGSAQALIEFDPVGAAIAVQPGDRRLRHGLYAFAVCNSRLIGGGRLIAPQAVIDDGLLDVCLIEAMSALEFVALARKVAGGDHVTDPRVLYLQAQTVRIELDREVKVNTDGEVFEGRLCDYRVLPKAARFLAGDAPFSSRT